MRVDVSTSRDDKVINFSLMILILNYMQFYKFVFTVLLNIDGYANI
jgi:hypothetical protein